jgi:EAL domain-containing protein (putative c-di-GMP-specific phosphodiesterase class I)
MDAALQARRQLEIDLRRALIEEELEVHFQPINDARTGAVRSFEALARWRHPERGMISSAEFIPLAEQTGLIVPLGEWVLRAACREAMHWPDEVGVSVNLSALQFKAPALTATIRNALTDTRLATGRLELEITESVLLDGTNDSLSILRDFHAPGIKIALDDFGTGYSSLSYLRSFPFDKLKIDQSFIRNSDVRDGREIVRAINSLGQTLGITTTRRRRRNGGPARHDGRVRLHGSAGLSVQPPRSRFSGRSPIPFGSRGPQSTPTSRTTNLAGTGLDAKGRQPPPRTCSRNSPTRFTKMSSWTFFAPAIILSGWPFTSS